MICSFILYRNEELSNGWTCFVSSTIEMFFSDLLRLNCMSCQLNLQLKCLKIQSVCKWVKSLKFFIYQLVWWTIQIITWYKFTHKAMTSHINYIVCSSLEWVLTNKKMFKFVIKQHRQVKWGISRKETSQ